MPAPTMSASSRSAPQGSRQVGRRTDSRIAGAGAPILTGFGARPTLSRELRGTASAVPAGMRRVTAMYSETTRSITVTVKPFYLEDQSSPAENRYVWAYHVRIENRGKETVQLRRRYWKITDNRGQMQEVRGPRRRRRAAGARPRRELRIHQRHAAADAVGHHGRHLRDGDERRRELLGPHSRLLARQPPSAGPAQLTAGQVRSCRAPARQAFSN